MRIRALAVVLLLSSLAACSARTDRSHYVAGDPAVATFKNSSLVTVFLGGCSAFGFQQLVDGEWIDRGTPIVCVWEGFAQPVPAGERRSFDFLAPEEAGTWRLLFPVGLGCRTDQPLSEAHCQRIAPVFSPEFRVAGLCEEHECGPALGMPNRLCADGVHFAGPTGRCLLAPDQEVCGWEIASCPEDAR